MFLADDNLLVREGVRGAPRTARPTSRSSGVAADYDELVAGADAAAPQVVVTDIRMPPSFQREGIEAAKEVRKRHPRAPASSCCRSTTTPSTPSRC